MLSAERISPNRSYTRDGLKSCSCHPRKNRPSVVRYACTPFACTCSDTASGEPTAWLLAHDGLPAAGTSWFWEYGDLVLMAGVLLLLAHIERIEYDFCMVSAAWGLPYTPAHFPLARRAPCAPCRVGRAVGGLAERQMCPSLPRPLLRAVAIHSTPPGPPLLSQKVPHLTASRPNESECTICSQRHIKRFLRLCQDLPKLVKAEQSREKARQK